MAELVPRLAALARLAKAADIGFTIDAEEAERLDLSLDIIEAVSADPALAGWDGLGLAIQAYQKRVLPLIDCLGEIARRHGRRLMVRLVKGAYWDSEIKRARSAGWRAIPSSPARPRPTSPISAARQRLLADADAFYPQFATHNAHTLAAVLEMAGNRRDFEFQRLHGMGEALYDHVVGAGCQRLSLPHLCARAAAMRICWPISCAGCWRTAPIPPSSTASSTRSCRSRRSSPIPSPGSAGCRRSPIRAFRCPRALFGPERRNSGGIDLTDRHAAPAAGRGDEQGRGRALARSAADRRCGPSGHGPSRARSRRPQPARRRGGRGRGRCGGPGAGAGGARAAGLERRRGGGARRNPGTRRRSDGAGSRDA